MIFHRNIVAWLTWTTTNSSEVTVVTNWDGTVQTNAPVSPIGAPQIASEHCVVPDDERNPPAAVYTPEGNPPSGILGERLAYDTVTQTSHDKYTRTAQTRWAAPPNTAPGATPSPSCPRERFSVEQLTTI